MRLVWAIDSEHAPAYWFPRECPRGTFWAVDTTTDADVERFLLGDRSLRVHAVQGDWLAAVRAARVLAYRLPMESFEPYGRAAGYWVSREPVVPLRVVEFGDSLARHADAGIELRASFRAFSGCGDSSPTRPSSTAVSASGTSRTG
jgi:hypothetical protein